MAYANRLPNYIQSTKITQTTIESPTISACTINGGDINGAAFHNVYGNACLELGAGGSGYGDLILSGLNVNMGGNKWEVFRVTDNIGGASLALYGSTFLSGSYGSVSASGTWDFGNATVKGITATFG